MTGSFEDICLREFDSILKILCKTISIMSTSNPLTSTAWCTDTFALLGFFCLFIHFEFFQVIRTKRGHTCTHGSSIGIRDSARLTGKLIRHVKVLDHLGRFKGLISAWQPAGATATIRCRRRRRSHPRQLFRLAFTLPLERTLRAKSIEDGCLNGGGGLRGATRHWGVQARHERLCAQMRIR